MNLASLSSLATNAFETTRSTFKAMAEAAVPPAESGASARSAGPARSGSGDTARDRAARPSPPPVAVRDAGKATGRVDSQDQASLLKGRRRGTVLDAYA